MSIVYNWINPNKEDITSIDIYRADKAGGTKTKLGTVSPGALGYEDNTAQVNRVYFYSTVVWMGSLSSPSIETPLASFENTGPGPQTLLRGDWDYGYFGEIPVSNTDLPTLRELCATLGVTYDSTLQSQHTKWYKWIVNGRILFIPSVWSVNAGVRANVTPKIFIPINGTERDALSWSKSGNNFYVRLPFANRLDAIDNKGISPLENVEYPFYKSELCALAASFLRSNSSTGLPVQYTYVDNPFITSNGNRSWTNTWTSENTMANWNALAVSSLSSAVATSNYGAYVILSLKFD